MKSPFSPVRSVIRNALSVSDALPFAMATPSRVESWKLEQNPMDPGFRCAAPG
jgi:hypothetical protein